MSALCRCGHTLGQHTHTSPSVMPTSAGACSRCWCSLFLSATSPTSTEADK